MFLVATTLLLVNVVFFVQAAGEACAMDADCLNGESCIHGVCQPIRPSDTYQTMAYCSPWGSIVLACTTKQYHEKCSKYYCIVNH